MPQFWKPGQHGDDLQIPSATEFVSAYGRPVFGMVDVYDDLRQFGRSIGADGSADTPTSIGLDFSAGPVNDPTAGVRIETRVVLRERLALVREFELTIAAYGAWWHQLGQTGRRTEMRRRQASDEFKPMSEFPQEVLTEFRLEVEGLGSALELRRWRTPGIVHGIAVEGEDTDLIVSTFGFETDELPELFPHIGRIDDRPDVLARYERETNDCKAQLGWTN
jgi:hypothetical protein